MVRSQSRRRFEEPRRQADHRATLSAVVPAFNEESTIEAVIRRVLAQETDDFSVQIVLVDDGSTDSTVALAEDLLRKEKDILIRHNVNLGKGAALRTAQPLVNGDYVVIQDADLEYSPEDWRALLKPLRNGYADAVFGTRFGGSGEKRVLYFRHTMGNKFLTFMSNLFTNLNLTDMETGYKAFKAEIFSGLKLSEKGFGIEPEIAAKLSKSGASIYEVPISYYGRTYEQGKKITWRDGAWAIWCIFRYQFGK